MLSLDSARLVLSYLTHAIGADGFRFACFCSLAPLLSHSHDWSCLSMVLLASARMTLSYLTHVIGAGC